MNSYVPFPSVESDVYYIEILFILFFVPQLE
jgi:hypothetical protein